MRGVPGVIEVVVVAVDARGVHGDQFPLLRAEENDVSTARSALLNVLMFSSHHAAISTSRTWSTRSARNVRRA